MLGVTEKADAAHPGTKHRPGQGVRESERGNSAGAIVAALLIAAPCQQGGPQMGKPAAAVPCRLKELGCCFTSAF